ncbi:MAG: alpha/beta hydrolase [Myxococcota bacterium]
MSPMTRVLRRVLQTDPGQEYLIYAPNPRGHDSPIVVSVHGVSRNVDEHARLLAPYCEKYGANLVVPHFTAEEHPDYQRLGRLGRGKRADVSLNMMLGEVALLTGASAERFHLFGFSGGAQFAHRYLMAHPHRITSAVVASAGWYTWPDPTTRYPYGTRMSKSLPGVRFDAEEYLQVPIHVIVGAEDLESRGLRRTDRVDAQQGVSRVERARRWVAAMNEFAEAHGLKSLVTYEELKGAGHSFGRSILRSGLGERAFEAMFGPLHAEARVIAG